MLLRKIYIAVFLLWTCSARAQPEASNWYFGENAGVSFQSGSPVMLTNGRVFANEGVATISDASGNLLFYTEGVNVWNRFHNLMPNGTGLKGHESSSQSVIVIPVINDPSRYYLFTTTELGKPDGFNYSILNMTLDGGKGDIEIKNVALKTPVCEKLTAVKHCNGTDYWVIVHRRGNAEFYAYQVSNAGVSNNPVVSTAGAVVPMNDPEYTIGTMKASPSGKKLAIAHYRTTAELLDFDNSTGIISNPKKFILPAEGFHSPYGPYGVEFSPDSRLVYLCADYYDFATGVQLKSYLHQYDALATTESSLQASRQVIYHEQSHWFTTNFGSLQTGPDGRIYLSPMGQGFISYISYPNRPGSACQFVYNGIQTNYTNGGRTKYGLPAYFPGLFRPSFTFRGVCTGNLINFDYARSDGEMSVKWDFGDPASGAANIAFTDSSTHLFTSEGTYTVKLIRFTACGSDTVTKTINAGGAPFTLGADTVLCNLSQYTLSPNISGSNYSYLWQNGSTQPDLVAAQDGIYWVDVTNSNNGCTRRDSILLNFGTNPVYTLGPDQSRCQGEQVILSPLVNGASYTWSTGSTQSNISVTQPGIYWVDVTTDGCMIRDSISFVFNTYPAVSLGADQILCEGAQLTLDAGNPGMQYLWQNGSTARTIDITGTGLYWVRVSNQNCQRTDTVYHQFLDKPFFTLGPDKNFCAGMTLRLQPGSLRGNNLGFLWNTGSTNQTISVSQEGAFTLTATNSCGVFSDDIIVQKGICKLYIPTAFTPNGDGLNDRFKVLFGDHITKFHLRVYDRWGGIVFQTQNYQEGWDGKRQGILLDSGVYLWTINYSTTDHPDSRFLKGQVTLIR